MFEIWLDKIEKKGYFSRWSHLLFLASTRQTCVLQFNFLKSLFDHVIGTHPSAIMTNHNIAWITQK